MICDNASLRVFEALRPTTHRLGRSRRAGSRDPATPDGAVRAQLPPTSDESAALTGIQRMMW